MNSVLFPLWEKTFSRSVYSMECEIKNSLHKLYNILEKQSGKTWTFAVNFVSLEFLNRNKYLLMIQELSCRNSVCILNIKLYRKMH